MKKLLKDVTLIAYSSNDIQENIVALQKCMEYFYFGAVKIISHKVPENLPKEIKHEYGKEIKDINDFNEYMFLNLYRHVNTSHCLYVQHHGFIINPELWDDEFLNWDYCGAVWKDIPNTYIANDGVRMKVGNGGFSIRSKKLLDLPKRMGWYLREEQGWANEDGNICCYWHREMLENGIKYAPVEVAAKFSYENPVPENNYGNMKTFGFHRNKSREDENII
jgi:hypothetical protein